MNAKRLSSKILSAVLAFLFVFSLIPISGVHVHAAESESITYLALGDSISTGYGLGNPTADGFTYRLASEFGYTLINKAVDGNTSADILDQLNHSQNASFVSSAELAEADVITITVGGNDLMALLYEKTAEQTADTTDTAADIPAKLQNGDYTTLVAAINLLTESREMYIVNDEDFPIAIDGIIANLNAIITNIRSVNSHAEIVVATQYNPYVEFENAVLAFLSLSAVYKGMEAGVNALNEAIVNNAAGKYTVSNVKAAFDGYTGTEDLYNAQPPAGTLAMNVDFHPTAAGHKLLADTLAATLETLDISDAPTTVTVEAPYDTMMFAGVTGAGEYEVGESVTLTATTFTDGYDTVFYYWLDNSVELSDDPTEAELRAAIVSYSPTFTFTAAENVSYTPIADYDINKLQVYVEGCLFEDDNFTAEGDGWGYTTEYDQVLFAGDEELTVSFDTFPETLTVEDKLYLRVGFALWDNDVEGEGSLILVKDTSITIPTSPIYNSVEYRNWRNKYASITVAYLFHAHSYETRFDQEGHWEECTCGDKTEREAHHLTNGECTECDYTDHVHSYETRFDQEGHWEECTDCGFAKEKQNHSTTVIVKSDGDYHYHYMQCATEGCEHRETENCTFDNDVYMGNAAGHWRVCDTCRKVAPNAVVGDHVDKVFDRKCDVCGESVEHTEHTYEWSSFWELYHQGTCDCGTFVTGSHTDDDKNQKCDTCNTDVSLAITNGQRVYIEYTPAERTTQTGNVAAEHYSVTEDDIGKIFNAATVSDKTVTYSTDTELGGVTLEAGKTYSYSVAAAQNVHVDGANGVLSLVATISESYGANTSFVGAHILGDGSVHFALADHSDDTCVSKWFISTTSPFIILAITEEGADIGNNTGDPTDPGDLDPEPQIDNDGLETWVIVLIVVGSALVLGGGGFAVYWFVIRKRRSV